MNLGGTCKWYYYICVCSSIEVIDNLFDIPFCIHFCFCFISIFFFKFINLRNK